MSTAFNDYSRHFVNDLDESLLDRGFHSSDAEHFSAGEEQVSLHKHNKQKKYRKKKKNLDFSYTLSELMEEGDELLDEEHYKQLFAMEYWSPFTDFCTGKLQFTEEDAKLLQQLHDEYVIGFDRFRKSRSKRTTNYPNTDRFKRIPHHIRSTFQHEDSIDHEFFETLETALIGFVLERNKKSLAITFNTVAQRYLASGIAAFYLLNSNTIDAESNSGESTVFSKSNELHNLYDYISDDNNLKAFRKHVLPSSTLSTYLKTMDPQVLGKDKFEELLREKNRRQK